MENTNVNINGTNVSISTPDSREALMAVFLGMGLPSTAAAAMADQALSAKARAEAEARAKAEAEAKAKRIGDILTALEVEIGVDKANRIRMILGMGAAPTATPTAPTTTTAPAVTAPAVTAPGSSGEYRDPRTLSEAELSQALNVVGTNPKRSLRKLAEYLNVRPQGCHAALVRHGLVSVAQAMGFQISDKPY